MQAAAAEFSGYARRIPLLFWREEFEQFVLIHLF